MGIEPFFARWPNACTKIPSENMIAAHRLFAAENYSCALYKGFERRLEAFFCLDGTKAGGGIKRAQGRLKRPCKRSSTPVFAIGGINALIGRFLGRMNKHSTPLCFKDYTD